MEATPDVDYMLTNITGNKTEMLKLCPLHLLNLLSIRIIFHILNIVKMRTHTKR